MLFKKYHIVIFKDHAGGSRKISLKGWTGVIVCLLLVLLATANFLLWGKYGKFLLSEQKLKDAEKVIQNQNMQILSFASKIKNLEKDLGRVRDFDSKLRVMVNIEQSQSKNQTPQGGPDPNAFSETYLPLYRQELLSRKIHDFLDELSSETKLEEVRQQDLFNAIGQHIDILASTPSVWPVDGWVSSHFGYRSSSYSGSQGFHKGIDIVCAMRTPVRSPAKGKVIFVGMDGAYGLSVVVDHGSGLATMFAHLNKAGVEVGQMLKRGEPIGEVGMTGRTSGPHLHYEVALNGVPVDPMRYILN